MKILRIGKALITILCLLTVNVFLIAPDEQMKVIQERIAMILNAPAPQVPPYGSAVLKAINNLSPYSISITKDKSINDFLPDGTVVALKSKKNNKYYTLKKIPRKDGSTHIVCVPDGTNKDDVAARLTVRQYVDFSLNQYLTFSPSLDGIQDRVMGVDRKGKIIFEQTEFNDEDSAAAHWTIQPEVKRAEPSQEQLSSVYLINRQTKGVLKSEERTENLLPAGTESKTESFQGIWGTSKAPRLPQDSNYVTYNSLVRIRADRQRDHVLWFLGVGDSRPDLQLKDGGVIEAGDWSGMNRTNGPLTLFILKKDGDPDGFGSVFAGDRFQIIYAPEDKNVFVTKVMNQDLVAGSLSKNSGIAEGDNHIFTMYGANEKTKLITWDQPVHIKSENKATPDYIYTTVIRDRWGNGILVLGKTVGDQRTDRADLNKFDIEQVPASFPEATKWTDARGLNKRSSVFFLNMTRDADGRYTGQETPKPKDFLSQLAVYGYEKKLGSNDIGYDVWGVGDLDNGLYYIKDARGGGVGQKIASDVRYVAVGGGDDTPVPWVVKTDNTVHKFTSGGLLPLPGAPSDIYQVAVKNQNEAWAITLNGNVYYYVKPEKGNGSWENIDKDQVSDAAEVLGALYGDFNSDRITRVPLALGQEVPGPVEKRNMWGDPAYGTVKEVRILLRQNGKLYLQTVKEGDKAIVSVANATTITSIPPAFTSKIPGFDSAKPSGNGAISIAVSAFPGEEKEAWIVRENGAVYRYNKDSKVWGQITQFTAKMAQIAVQKSDDVYGVDRDRNIWHYNGSTVTQISGKWATIAATNGSYKRTLKEVAAVDDTYTSAFTLNKEGKPFGPDSDALIEVEIVQAAAGKGDIGEKSTRVFKDIPVTQNPQVEGFARKDFPNIDLAAYDLNLVKLINKGAAWIKTSFDQPGRASIKFYAKAGDTGDIQILFGNQINPGVFVWKIVIGADGNSQAKIIKYDNGNQILLMDPITRQQNPLAVAAPGRVIPYWVSIDMDVKDPSKGAWIAIGRSEEIGKNIIMACRDPQPPATVTYVGFATNKDPVNYSQIRIGEPIVIKPPKRVYIARKDKVSLSTSKAIDWKDWERLPFRIANQGSIQFTLQGTKGVALALSTAAKDNAKHYAIVFGNNNNTELVVKKWDQKTNAYLTLGTLPYRHDQSLALDPKKAATFWVSYNEGLIIIGKGNQGRNPIMVVNDVDAYNGIEVIGFASQEGAAASISDVEIAPEVALGYADKKEGYYQRSMQLPSVKGDVVVLLPFRYIFSQQAESGSVICKDQVTGDSRIIISTPRPGVIYPFIVKIDESGAAKLEKFEDPYNPLADLWKKRLARLEIAKKALIDSLPGVTAAGESEKKLSEAEAKKFRDYAEAGQKTAADLTSTGIQMITAGGAIQTGSELLNPIAASAKAMVIGAGAAVTAGGLIRGGLTEIDAREAANKEFEGAQSVAAAEKRAAELQDMANKLAIEEDILKGDAKFAITSKDAYMYVDKPSVRDLGSASIPQSAQENKKQVVAALKVLDSLKSKLKTVEAIDAYITQCENIMTLIDHYFVISDVTIKKRIIDSLKILRDTFMEASSKIPEKLIRTRTRLVKVLFSALNNSFLADDRAISSQWYVWINEMMRDVLGKSDKQEIELPVQYGEYIWIPGELKNNEGGVTFLVKGTSDLFIALSPTHDKRLRNDAQQEFYEVLFCGWINTKTVIRLKSLDRAAKEFTVKKYPELKLDPFEFKQVWIMYKAGMITGGFGAPGVKPLFSWKDSYPIKGISYVGLSTWDSPIVVKNIQLFSLDKMPAMIAVPETKASETEEEMVEEEYYEEEEDPDAEIVIEGEAPVDGSVAVEEVSGEEEVVEEQGEVAEDELPPEEEVAA